MLIVTSSQCWVAAKSPCLGLEGQVLGLDLGLEGLVLVNISDNFSTIRYKYLMASAELTRIAGM